MGNYDSGRATDLGGINIEARRGDSLNGIRFDSDRAADPSSANDFILYRIDGLLKIWDGSSVTTLGAAGATVNFSLNDAYDDGRVITCDDGAVTINGVNMDTATLALNADAASSGPIILFTNAGSGNDITGTSSLWSVSAAGAGTFASLVAASVTAAASLTIDATGAGTITIAGTSTGLVTIGAALTLAASKALTITGVEGSNEFVMTAGDAVITLGSLSITDNDNAESFTLINNTATTIGNASSTSVFQIESTSLTTGAAVNVQLTEGTLNGGYYYSAWDMTDGVRVFSIAEDGALTIRGNGGSTVVTVTAGDMVLSDASLAITDADNAASFTLTNNTATTASVAVIVGNGAFTGSTTTSFMTVTPSGLTTGTGIYEALAAITQGKGLHITAGASLTTGSLLYVQDTGANSAVTSGTVATFDMTATAITGTVNKIGAGVSITSNRTVTTGTVSDDWDSLSLIQTDIINGAGSFAVTGSILHVEKVTTNTSGTVADTTKGIEVVMAALGTGDGIEVTTANVAAVALDVHGIGTTVHDVLITGTGAHADDKAVLGVVGSGATAAGGSILRVSGTGTPAAETSYLVDLDASGRTMTNNPIAVQISSGTSTGAALNITSTAAAITGGVFNLSMASATTGVGISAVNADALTTGSIAKFVSNSADATARSLVYIKNDHASAVGAAPLEILNDAVTGTGSKFKRGIKLCNITLWVSIDGTSPNGALTGDNVGDMCFNASTGKPLICTGTNVWAAAA